MAWSGHSTGLSPAARIKGPGGSGTVHVVREGSRKWWILGATAAGIFMMLIDETVVGVAVPSLQDDLGLSAGGGHWVVNVYLLVMASLVALGGKLADVIGAGRNYVIGVVIFALASLAAGLAPTAEVLMLARVGQGVGAAIIYPMGLALVALVLPPQLRGFAIGVVAGSAAFAITIGPLVGGALIDALSWRWIFLINPIVAIPVLAVVVIFWREPERERRASLDVLGLVTLSLGLAGVVLGLMQADAWGWDSPRTLGAIGGGILALAVFTAYELRRKVPLIDLRLLRRGTVASGNLIVFTAQFTKAAQIVFLAIYFQQVLGMSALTAGLALVPAGILGLFASLVIGRLIDRIGARIPGLAALAVTAACMAWIAAGIVVESYALMVPALLLIGVSIQVLFAAPMTAISLTTPASLQGETSGIISTSQMVGGTFGIAIFSALITSGLSYATVFLVGAGVATAVLALAMLFFDRARDEAAEAGAVATA